MRVRPSRATRLSSSEMVTVVVALVVVPPHAVGGTVLAVEVQVAGKFE